MIDKAKLGAIIDSAHGYLDSVEKFYFNNLADNSEFELDGFYVVNNGKLNEYEILINGKIPSSGRLIYNDNEVIEGCLTFDNDKVLIHKDKFIFKNGRCFEGLNQQEKLGLEISISNDGLYESDEQNRYVYKGKNPNNYIWLDENGDKSIQDEELYRIISYEADGTTKVIRNKPFLQKQIWDYSQFDTINTRKNNRNLYCANWGCNVYGNQYNTLYQNETIKDEFTYLFYLKKDDTKKTSMNSGTVVDESAIKIYLNSWLDTLESLKTNVTNHNFYVGSLYFSSGGNYYWQLKDEITSYTWNGNVGLINYIELLETSSYSQCPNNYKSCLESNWLNAGYDEWTITPQSSTKNRVYYIYGTLNDDYAHHTHEVRPTFYLKSDITLYGTGTKDLPYYIKEY